MSRNINELHPRLQVKAAQLKEECAKQGIGILFGECVRTVVEQDALYAQGRTKPGSIVTNAKGSSYSSQHQWGIAVDFYLDMDVDGDGAKSDDAFNDSTGLFEKVGAIAKSIGLGWGGDWTSPRDLPHLYLPDWGDTPSKLKQQYKTPEAFKATWGTANAGTSTAGSASQSVNITYAVKLDDGRILPEVKNLSDYAGIENKKIVGIAAKVDRGYLKYQVHTVGGGWLPYVDGYNWNEPKNGYAGNGKPIDAVRMYYDTPSDIVKTSGYKKVKYRVSAVGSASYYDWQYDDEKTNGQDGYAGLFGKTIDKLQAVIT